ncbi:zinc-dependent metalloprotease family protein [Vibrio sp. ZOR0018]|uniref:zinc-dependent metalloprotease family protein n=1 Tax=Vibrio sp. ZOR0018 TaxID=1339225 RepID=UPI0006489D73|nr:zinc-dependent metalloprotease family protein [Vibrio sp. ZOR0018]
MKIASLALAVVLATHALPSSATTEIDILGVYTPGTAEWFQQDHVAQIQHRFNVGNEILRQSGLDIKVNLIGTKEVKYDTQRGLKKSQEQALDAITPGNKQDPAFADIEQYRKQVGADMVALFRNLDIKNSPDYEDKGNGTYMLSCGLAWIIPAAYWNNSARYAQSRMYSHSYLNECGDDTFIHELGHNLGLNHAHEQYNGEPHLSNGTEQDAYGYGVQGQFATTMAYGFLFGIHSRSYTFSNPSKVCKGQACGVTDYANSVRAIGLSAPHIAAIYARPDGSNDGGTSPTEPTSPQQAIYDLQGPFAIPDHAQGELALPINVTYQGNAETATIQLDIAHPFVGDVSVKLYAPDGGYWNLKSYNQYDRNTAYRVRFTLSGMQQMNVQGQWRLVVADHYQGLTGVLNSARLSFE